ncbi:hypothetical protein ACFX2H_014219 [Malus domestica]
MEAVEGYAMEELTSQSSSPFRHLRRVVMLLLIAVRMRVDTQIHPAHPVYACMSCVCCVQVCACYLILGIF